VGLVNSEMCAEFGKVYEDNATKKVFAFRDSLIKTIIAQDTIKQADSSVCCFCDCLLLLLFNVIMTYLFRNRKEKFLMRRKWLRRWSSRLRERTRSEADFEIRESASSWMSSLVLILF
jgi:hypothetical protein